MKARVLDGWVVCNLDLQSDSTGRQTLQVVFFLGKSGDGDGLHAAATMNLSTPQAAQLGDVWGAALQRVLWDAVLDVVEAAVAQVATQKPGQPLTLQGFSCAADGIHVALLAGAN